MSWSTQADENPFAVRVSSEAMPGLFLGEMEDGAKLVEIPLAPLNLYLRCSRIFRMAIEDTVLLIFEVETVPCTCRLSL